MKRVSNLLAVKKANGPKSNESKTGDVAAGHYIAEQIFKKNTCYKTRELVLNQLILNGFLNFDFKNAIKLANNLLKNRYNRYLYLINGYLVQKNYYKLQIHEPILEINGNKANIKKFRLFVYDSLQNIICTDKSKHEEENVTINTTDIFGKYISFNIFHCKKCGKFYTNIEAVKKHFSLHQHPLVHMEFETRNSFILNEESELKIYGYNVQKDVLSDYERKKLLAILLKYGFLTKQKVIQILHFNIQFHNSINFSEARKKWQADIEFVQNASLKKQLQLDVSNIEIVY